MLSLTAVIKYNSSKTSITLHPNAKQKGRGGNTMQAPIVTPGEEPRSHQFYIMKHLESWKGFPLKVC